LQSQACRGACSGRDRDHIQAQQGKTFLLYQTACPCTSFRTQSLELKALMSSFLIAMVSCSLTSVTQRDGELGQELGPHCHLLRLFEDVH
jgi:hypothetical protein